MSGLPLNGHLLQRAPGGSLFAGSGERLVESAVKTTSPVHQIEKLTEQIRAYVFRDGRKPGDRIETEEELASTFDVSRHQVRRVLNTMVQQGLLTKTPRRGTFIRHFDPAIVATNLRSSFEVSDFAHSEYVEARLVIERAVLPLAVKRISPEQIKLMEKSIDRMLQLSHIPEQADEADRDFHMILLASCGNKILSSFSTIISMLFHDSTYRKQYWNPATISRLAREHRKILRAIAAGDTETALTLHEQHLHYRQKLHLDTQRRELSTRRTGRSTGSGRNGAGKD